MTPLPEVTMEEGPTIPAADAAQAYIEDGFKVVPVPAGKKAPRIKGWQDLKLSNRDVAEQFRARTNLGVLLGKKAKWLVDVDLDADEAVAAAEAFLPKTGWIHGRSGKRRSHWFYRAAGATTRRFKDPQGDCLVELRSTGHQTLVPPSTHPSGDRYRWDAAGKPSRVSANELGRAVARVAACALVARSWPKKGQRHDCALALAGMLLRAGWPTTEVEHFLKTAAKIAGDEESKKRSAVARDTQKKLKEGKAVSGRPKLAGILGTQVVDRITEWLEIKGESRERNKPGTSMNRVFSLSAVRLIERDRRRPRRVELKAQIPGKKWTFRVAPAIVRDPKRLAGVIANETGEMLNNDDPQLDRPREQMSTIPRIRGVSTLGWTPELDAFIYGHRVLRTKGHKEKLIFLTEEDR